MGVLNLTELELFFTQEAMLAFRILGRITTNTTFLKFAKGRSDRMRYFVGKPPSRFPSPATFVWFNADDTMINANDSTQFKNLYCNIKIGFINKVKYEALDLVESTGVFKEPMPIGKQNHTADLEAWKLKQAIQALIETEGYDKNWYYWFVEHGDKEDRKNIRFNLTGVELAQGSDEIENFLMTTFRIETWMDATNDIDFATGSLDVTVNDDGGSPVEDAIVTLTDVSGMVIWNTDGERRWLTDASGEVTIENLPAQTQITVSATKSGVGSGDTDMDYPDGIDNSDDAAEVTVEIS